MVITSSVPLRLMVFQSILTHAFVSNLNSIPLDNSVEAAFKPDLQSNHCSSLSLPTSWPWPLSYLPWIPAEPSSYMSACSSTTPTSTPPMVYSQHSTNREPLKLKSSQYLQWHQATQVWGKSFHGEDPGSPLGPLPITFPLVHHPQSHPPPECPSIMQGMPCTKGLLH